MLAYWNFMTWTVPHATDNIKSLEETKKHLVFNQSIWGARSLLCSLLATSNSKSQSATGNHSAVFFQIAICICYICYMYLCNLKYILSKLLDICISLDLKMYLSDLGCEIPPSPAGTSNSKSQSATGNHSAVKLQRGVTLPYNKWWMGSFQMCHAWTLWTLAKLLPPP